MARVFVIDDDRHMRTACVRVLEAAGYMVACAETGADGLEQIRNNSEKPDVVLLDHLMPGMNGMDVMAQIHLLNPQIPVVIMTGSVTEASASTIIEQGAQGCLPKPFTPEQLRDVVKRVTEGV